MANTRKNRSSRRSTRRANTRRNMAGGAKKRRGVARAVYRPVGTLARGTSRTLTTAAKAGIKLFEDVVSGANKTVRAAASTINSTVSSILPRNKKSTRRHRRA